MIEIIKNAAPLLKDLAAIAGSVSALATALAHLPLPARLAAFFARVGVASGKFAVSQKAAS